MQTLFLNILFTAIRRIVTAELFAEILRLVQIETDSTLSGPQKKAAVMTELNVIKGQLGVTVSSLASWVLSMAVDIAVTEINKKAGLSITK
ncbi:hypothetical protein [Methylotenera sp.]|uniref:hypothetical protein n=1 Tax=Methylotenera sp. TaxID=2051956 RepID=UPI002489A6DF|nr:hypothetical protein [Methylotenera sp.]MDI1362499.1 hypothetical protein [Methylotenera sp.]